MVLREQALATHTSYLLLVQQATLSPQLGDKHKKHLAERKQRVLGCKPNQTYVLMFFCLKIITCTRVFCFLCLSPYIFTEWHIVPLLYIQIKLSRACSRKALYGCKASRRLGKYMRGFNCFC